MTHFPELMPEISEDYTDQPLNVTFLSIQWYRFIEFRI